MQHPMFQRCCCSQVMYILHVKEGGREGEVCILNIEVCILYTDRSACAYRLELSLSLSLSLFKFHDYLSLTMYEHISVYVGYNMMSLIHNMI